MTLSVYLSFILGSAECYAQTVQRILATYYRIRQSSVYNSYQIAAERAAVDIVTQLQRISSRSEQTKSWNKTKQELGAKVAIFYVGYGFQIIRGSGAISKEDLLRCVDEKVDFTPFENDACRYLLKNTRDSLGYRDLGNLENRTRIRN